MNKFEEKIIINIQKYSCSPIIINYMNVVSNLFNNHTNVLLFTIIIYLFNFISDVQLLSLLLLKILSSIIKFIIRRNRPADNSNKIKNRRNRPLNNSNKIKTKDGSKYSFPSYHTTYSFLVYFILNKNHIINNSYNYIY